MYKALRKLNDFGSRKLLPTRTTGRGEPCTRR